VQVNRLRRKVEKDLANPVFIQTVRGAGYRLVVD
jgi:two-component system, OmpR family, phosphate regulon response regulator OmpR